MRSPTRVYEYGRDGVGFLSGEMDLAPADLEFMADEALGPGFLHSVIESFRQGVDGCARDARSYVQPWSFDPGAVSVPVIVLHGEADTVVPLAHGRHTAELVPGARLVTFPEHGHLSIVREVPGLAADLATALV